MATRKYRPRSCPACAEQGAACGQHNSFYEPRDMSKFIARIARAMVERAIKSGDTEVLVALREMRAALDEADLLAGRALYYGSPDPNNPLPEARAWGYSWGEIGQELGITRQAAEQRYGVRPTLRKNRAQGPADHAAAS